MARTFGGTLDAVVTDTRGNTLAGINVHAWDAPTAGTDLGTTVSGVDGSFELTLDTTAPGVYVSAGTTGPRRYVPAREAVPDLITSLANKTNNATTAALSDRVDTTETRVGTVEDEVAGRLSAPVLSSTIAEQIAANGGGGARVANLPANFIIAHRGGCAVAPEHTFAAYDLAISQGADAIELDVQLLADGTPAVFHDSTLDRVTNGTGAPSTYSAPGWKNLTVDAASWFGGGWPDQGAPLLLGDVLARYGNRVVWFIELKQLSGPLNDAVTSLVQRFGLTESVVLGSTNFSVASGRVSAGMHAYYDDPTGTTVAPATIAAAGIEYVLVDSSASAATITALKAAGLKVAAYTVNTQKEMTDQRGKGAGGIYTDQVLYSNGAANGYKYRAASAPWVKDGRIPHGIIDIRQGTSGGNLIKIVGGTGAYRLQPDSTHRSAILQGWACPLPTPTAYTLTIPVTFDTLDSNAASWAGVYFGFTNDTRGPAAGDVPGSGYLAMIRQTGSMDLYRAVNGVYTNVGNVPTAAITAGQTATVTVKVDATGVVFTRTDSGGFTPITYADTNYRGPYFHLRANTNNAGLYSFGAVAVS